MGILLLTELIHIYLQCFQQKKKMLEIIYKDDFLVAINKPHGLLVHRTSLANDATEFALQNLRNQLNRKVYPCHRLDRKTSGVLLFAFDEDANSKMQRMFAENKVQKKYLTIVRGYTPEEGIIDYPLKREDGKIQEAVTNYKTLEESEIDIPDRDFNTARYSLVEVVPQSGRMHQIRKHFAHIYHPVIGDRPYGCNKQNRIFKERWGITTMMLHAKSIEFLHPKTKTKITIIADPHEEFIRAGKILKFKYFRGFSPEVI